MFARLLVNLVALLFFSITVAAQTTPIEVSDAFSQRKIGLDLVLLEDPSTQLTLEQVRQPDLAARFTPSSSNSPSFGHLSSTPKFKISRNFQTPVQ